MMGHLFIVDLWGSSSGPLHRLTPQARLLGGVTVFVSCLVVSPEMPAGLLYTLLSLMIWLPLSGIPVPALLRLGAIGLVLFAPFFVLTPWIDAAGTSSQCIFASKPICVPWRIFIKGTSSMLVATATMSTLSFSDFYEAVLSLPLPRLVKHLLVQIIHQTRLLYQETSRIAQAISVRGASRGWRTGFFALKSLPSVWLPRIINRAERVGAAMELRGYGGLLPSFENKPLSSREFVVLAVCFLWLMGGLAIQYSLIR